MIQFKLEDNSLYYLGTNVYHNSLVADRSPKNFEWVKHDNTAHTFCTYTEFNKGDDALKKSAIMLESSSIIPHYIKWIFNNANKFEYIYTHNSDLLNQLTNARWIPGGGIWIGTPFGGGEVNIYNKSKLVSFMSSDKVMCDLHKIRFGVFEYLRTGKKKVDIDLYGPSVQNSKEFIKPIQYLKDYMFSIIFENYVDDMYFTEKILNCFATGTIPIYLGAKNLGSIFNMDGVITFSCVSDLLAMLEKLTPELYANRIEAIRNNFDRCQQFACIEDFMWEHYLRDKYESRNIT